jgi:hypothetical protein
VPARRAAQKQFKNPFEKVKTVPGHPVKISGVAAQWKRSLLPLL